AGKPPLKLSQKLSQIAQSVAEDLARLGDLRKGETTYAAQVRKAGYRYRLLGEAAASGQSAPDQGAEDWLDNALHPYNPLAPFSARPSWGSSPRSAWGMPHRRKAFLSGWCSSRSRPSDCRAAEVPGAGQSLARRPAGRLSACPRA